MILRNHMKKELNTAFTKIRYHVSGKTKALNITISTEQALNMC